MTRLPVVILRSILFGLVIAAVLIAIFPELRHASGRAWGKFNNTIVNEPASYHHAANTASPAVVNIYTRKFSTSSLAQEAELLPQGLGSGVVMASNGYLLTNHHVIADADQIIVALQDGRLFTAELVGSDQYTDLAVLRVESNDLPVIPTNDDYQPKVGDVVLAIGNPYNIGQTITQGIISATGRSGMSSTGRQDFLQTDAAINRGNSGGALVNSRGELVGINTSVFHLSPDAETFGISFAIPYPLAKRIMDALIKNGRVIRGYLGVKVVNINPVMARLWNLGDIQGIIVEALAPDSPALAGGLRPNDVIVTVNDVQIQGVNQAMDLVAEARPGTEIQLGILRNGEPQTLTINVGELINSQPMQ